MNETKITSSRIGAVVTSCQISSNIALEDPLSVMLSDGSPLRPGLIRIIQMNEGRVDIGSSVPAVPAAREIVPIRCSQGNLVTDSEHLPMIGVVLYTNCEPGLGSSDMRVHPQELPVISLESDVCNMNGVESLNGG